MQKTSKLDAVNTMLIALGIRPVNTLTPPHGADVAQALHVLDETSREVQARGWHFNTVVKNLTPDAVTKKIYLPPNIVRIDALDPYTDAVQIGEYLYDEEADTYEWTGPLRVSMVLFREWEELPETARQYIGKRATRMLTARIRGGSELQSPSFDEASAKADLEDFDSETADYNIFNNYAAGRIIWRNYRRGLEWG